MEPALQRDDDGAQIRGRRREGAARARADAELPDAPRRAQAAGCCGSAGEGVQGEHPPLHPHHQHAGEGQGDLRSLARLQGRGRQPPPRQPRRTRGGGGAGRIGAGRLSANGAPLLRHEGQVARQAEAGLLGPQRAAARPARAHRAVAGGGSNGARGLWRIRPAHGDDRQAVLRRCVDRRAGARGQVARRLLASDRAVGASLHSHELPGQGARCHDARPRAGPRRAPGAGGAARPFAGADAADARRDRIGVRRDADLQGAAGLEHATPRRKRPCWRRRWRT